MAASTSESSPVPCDSTAGEKPVVVRVKRKSCQSPLDAFWLEINERPLKRPILEFEKLSLCDDNDSSHVQVEDLKTKKVLVRHFETIGCSEAAAIDVVQSIVSNYGDAVESKPEIEERKQNFKRDNKKVQLLSKGRKDQEVLAQNARFEQIWRSRRGKKRELHDKLHEMCHFYDVARVDGGEESNEVQEQETMSSEDQRILSSYLPLIREFIPSAIAEIESDISAYLSKQGCEFVPSTIAEIESEICAYWPRKVTDDYVYDYYAVANDMVIDNEDAVNPFPLVQVEDGDFYDGPDEESEYDSDDSNAEDHPWNDYPDEESEEEDEVESEASTHDSEEENDDASSRSSEYEYSKNGSLQNAAAQSYENDDDNVDSEACDNSDYDDIDEYYG